MGSHTPRTGDVFKWLLIATSMITVEYLNYFVGGGDIRAARTSVTSLVPWSAVLPPSSLWFLSLQSLLFTRDQVCTSPFS